MNTFELVFVVDETVPKFALSVVQQKVYQQIWIDDVYLDGVPAIDLSALLRSLFHPGKFRIFTCDNDGCTSIGGNVLVRHEQGSIHWRFQRPIWSQPAGATPKCDECKREGVQLGKWIEYTFDRTQMLSDIASALCVIGEQTSPDAIYSPHGFERKHLEALKPYGMLADIPGAQHSGQNLFFLVDEKDQFLLEGQFVSLNDLGLEASIQQRFQRWLQDREAHRTNPQKREAWLEATRALMLEVARSALPKDAAIHLIARRNASDGTLDPWNPECYSIDR